MVGLSGIAVKPDRLRRLRPEVVNELAESIRAQGLLHPIILRPRSKNSVGFKKGICFVLVAGRHRLEAVRKLEHDSIRAEIREGLEAEAAELAEIDENLVRADLSPVERAMHVARRKEIYEEQHPETKQGGAPGAGRGKKKRSQESQNETFVKDTARKTGRGRSTVARDATRGSKIKVLTEVAGTSLDQGAELDALAKLPDEEQHKLAERAKAGEKVSAKTRVKQISRQEREVTLAAKQLALPDQKFGVILEDFEWDFLVNSRETGMDRHAANHYAVSEDAHTPEEIVERTKGRFAVAADDCVLFMWVPIPHLAIGIHVLELRGFKYKSNVAWGKDKIGTGFWFRERHEHLLVGVKGNVPCPAPGEQWNSLQLSARGRHSEKPDWAYELIEKYFPTLPKIELNACSGRPGWVSWGNEAPEQAA
jgi:N6-adenosine-specific RNA methylase IME4/ParB-like chromosome segregation protein Spo0J